MKNVLEQVAPHLLTVACYDREVHNFLQPCVFCYFISVTGVDDESTS